MDKNWFGMVSHPTDGYIHWSDKMPRRTAMKLRAAYDILIHNGNPTLIELLRSMTQAAYDAGEADERDSNDPDI